jgi:hemoglobin
MRLILPLLLLLLIAAPGPAARAAETRTLCARPGGPVKIARLVETGVDSFLKDKRFDRNPDIRALRKNLNVKQLKTRLSDMLCMLTGGPCFLSGPLLKEVPGPISLSAMEWIYAVQGVNRVLQDAHVSRREQVELVGLLLKHARAAK